MIHNAHELGAGAPGVYDVCIVGAGAAGITLALELARGGRRVCILEAGGAVYDATAQRLADGEVEGDPYPPLRSTRMFALGGTTHVWAGWCRPLDAADFVARPAVDRAGWPFGRDTLLPYYRRAHERCGLAAFDYDADGWRERLGGTALIDGREDIGHAIFHVRVRNFSDAFRAALEESPTLDVLLHATASTIDIGSDGTVRGMSARTASRAELSVHARHFVLAAGGIENARLLLASATSTEPAPGNRHGHVGRYFSDHPFLNPGWLVLHGPPRRLDYYFPRRVRDGASVRTTLTVREEAMEREALLGSALFFHPRYEAHAIYESAEVRAMLEVREKLRSRAVPGAAGPLLRRALRRPDRIAIAALRRLLVRDGPASRWRVRMMFETAFDAENRVELANERDALGRPRARLRWRVSDDDLERMRRALQLYDRAFRAAGIGRLELTLDNDADSWRQALEGGKHHMGTTRMHADPRHGVVDADCRVHGSANLFVVGSSVFPSGGYANPTLTVVALAIRLADHLAGLAE
jgi:choline dehydrogenase-like flavoprotein